MPFYTFEAVAMVVFAIFFYRAGQFDGSPGLLWAALSIAVSFLAWQGLKWGLIGMLLGQIGLFVGIGIFRVCRKS